MWPESKFLFAFSGKKCLVVQFCRTYASAPLWSTWSNFFKIWLPSSTLAKRLPTINQILTNQPTYWLKCPRQCKHYWKKDKGLSKYLNVSLQSISTRGLQVWMTASHKHWYFWQDAWLLQDQLLSRLNRERKYDKIKWVSTRLNYAIVSLRPLLTLSCPGLTRI